VLDGEVVVLDERGRSSFQRLQQLSTSRRGLAFFAFDLLALDGEDLKPLPLEARKRRLETLIGQRPGIIRYSPHFDGDGRAVLAHACRLGAEGIVSKCRTAPYRAGSRSPARRVPPSGGEPLTGALRAAFRDPGDVAALRDTVCSYVDAARARGEPVERVIIDLKQEMRAAGVVDCYVRPGERAVAESVIRWCIERFYGSAPRGD
jgi:hypothetical protein